MIHFTVLPLVVVAALASFAAASHCKRTINYCGHDLLNLDSDYGRQIPIVLRAAGQPVDGLYIRNSLFFCGAKQTISFLKYCEYECVYGGEGNQDYCYYGVFSEEKQASPAPSE